MPMLPSPIQQIFDPLFEEKGVKVFVKREDLIHPVIMGNKWRKLKYNLANAKAQGLETIVTPGGAFSNHILATAAAAKELGLKSIGIIRGEELNESSNPTLQKAVAHGMQMEFISRSDFESIRSDPKIIQRMYPQAGFIPEGGTNALAIKGCAELVAEIKIDYDFICSAIGTGGTVAGVIHGVKLPTRVLGFSSLKGDFVHSMVKSLLTKNDKLKDNYQTFDQYHFGGYAKVTDNLVAFINDFHQKHQILLDPIYTGKMFYGVIDLIKKDFFKFNHRIILLHTGGIQGIEGYNMMNKRKIS